MQSTLAFNDFNGSAQGRSSEQACKGQMGYVEEQNCPPPNPDTLSGSVAEAKRIAIKNSLRKAKSKANDNSRLKDKLRTKLRQYDRHKKEVLHPQSSMDWVMQQDGIILDFVLFGLQCCMVKSVKAVLPFAVSLLSHHVKREHFSRAREIVESFLGNLNQQAEVEVVEPAANLNGVDGWYKKYRNSTVWSTCKKLYVYVITLALHGVEKCNERDIGRLAEKTILKKFEDTADVVVNIVSLLKSLVTNFYQCIQSGRWSDFFHSEDTYTKWYNDNLEVERIMRDTIIPNDAQDVIERTKILIKQGEEILQHMRYMNMPRKEILVVNSRLLATRDLYAKFTGAIVGTQLRRQPFCIFVCGRSKIGKSSFMKANHLLYAKLFNKDATLEPFMRQPGDKHWDGLQNNQWALTYDDVCAHNPNKVMGVDEFHKEFFHVSNVMAKLAECAALEDKGSKPLLFDLVQVSSNVADLSAVVYLKDTAALYRRLQHRVKLEVKLEYLGEDGFLDPTKIPKQEGFPDLWNITVEYAATAPTNDGDEVGVWRACPDLVNMNAWKYMVWFKQRAEEHVELQNKFLTCMRDVTQSPTCEHCGMFLANHPDGPCGFEKLVEQAASEVEEETKEDSESNFPMEESDDPEFSRLIDEYRNYQELFGEKAMNRNGDVDGRFHASAPRNFARVVRESSAAEFVREKWNKYFSYRANKLRVLSGLRNFMDYVHSSVLEGLKEYSIAGVTFTVLNFLYGYYTSQWTIFLLTRLPIMLGLPLALIFVVLTHPFYFLQLFGANMNVPIMHEWMYNLLLTHIAHTANDKFQSVGLAGAQMYRRLGGTSKLAVLIAAVVFQAALLIAAFRYYSASNEERDRPRVIPQGGLQSVSLLPGDEPENVWRRRDYRCNVMDIPLPSSSLKGASEDMIVYYFQRSLVRISFLWSTKIKDRYIACSGTGFFVGGNKILFVSHFTQRMSDNIEGIEIVKVRVTYYTKCNQTKMAEAVYDPHEITRFDEETSIIEFPAMPAQKAMQANIPDASMMNFVGPGLQIGRQREGGLTVASIKRIWCERHAGQITWVVPADGHGPYAKTEVGDCGSLLLALTPKGPVLVGLHMWITADGTKSISYNLCGKNFNSVVSEAPPFLDKPGKVGNLGDLHENSPIRYLDDLKGLDVLGSFDGFRATPKSKVTKTLGANFLIAKHGFELTHGKPVMRGREVRWRHVKQLREQNATIPTYRAETCCAIFLDHVLKFRKENHRDWKPYILCQRDAINGVAGKRFLDRIPINTSVGFPFRGPKTNFIQPVVPGDWTSELRVNEELQEIIDATFERWLSGLRAAPVFTASLKDEARKFSKIDEKNTRVFFGGPAAFIIAQRQLFSWFTRLVQTHPLVFMQAPGMDANGSQWNLLAKYLLDYDKFIAGDFKDFDISMVIQILRTAYKFIIILAGHLGADEQHIQLMEAAAEDLVNPVVDYFGDLIMSTGKNPSGQALTVHINGIVNALYMIFSYIELHPDTKPTDTREVLIERGAGFFENVRAIFYGDDNLMSVSDDIPWFNHTALANLMSSHDVVYTMADKGAESVPYIPFSEATFLKRHFRFEDEVEGYVAPLEEASIRKALLLHIPSGVVSDQEAYTQTIASQNDMMWHHGREKFEAFRLILLELIEECELEEYFLYRNPKPMLATWDELKARWIDSLEKRENRDWVLLVPQSSITIEGPITSCQKCGRCPFIFEEDEIVVPCRLCGGCLIDGDPWCINCLEDGFCSCGNLFDVVRTVMNDNQTIRLYLACEECDSIRIKDVPLTRTFANQNGLRFPEA